MLKTNKNDIFRYALYRKADQQFKKIHANYCPIRYDNFITICADNDYPYWGEALELSLAPLHNAGINVIMFSVTDRATYDGVLNINNIDIRHAAYLLEKGKYHFCAQDWSLTLSQNNDLYNNVFLATGDETELFRQRYCDIIKDLEKPELVAEQIFKKLNLDQKQIIKSKVIGPSYGVKILELIPDFELTGPPNVSPGTKIGIRCDLVENWDFVLAASQMGLRPVVTSKTLPTLPIASFLTGISCINLFVTEDTKPEDIQRVEAVGIRVKLLSNDESSEKVKRNLFDYDNICVLENWYKNNLDKLQELDYDTRLRTKKLLVGKSGTFVSVYHWKNSLPTNHPKGTLLLDAVEDEDFLLEADTFYYYK